MNTTPLSIEHLPPDAHEREAWDPFKVWSERVRGRQSGAAPEPLQGWDPYFVWLSRVRRTGP
ncbi:MAG TPA: hypothetical protein VKB41_08125 [Steroidobacteraceae bacterium]|nr:hypothetical protein [Steroidobacteraceae bacterium]